MDRDLNALLALDPAALSRDERLDLLAAIERGKAALDAQAQRALHLLSREGDAEMRQREWVREEVAGVLRLAPVTAAARLHVASELVTRLPATLALLGDGAVSLLQARTLVDAVEDFDAKTTAKIEARVLKRAEDQTAGEFRQAVKRAVLACDPRTADEQHADAYTQRRVRLFEAEHGMATVWAHLRADQAAELFTSVDAHAAALTGPDDDRTADQKRADVLADLATLALRNAPVRWQGRKPTIQVSVALSTLLGLDDQPGDLDGYGPICPALARAIAADPTGTWRRLVTDPAGRLLDYEQTVYRAPAPLREHVFVDAGTIEQRRNCQLRPNATTTVRAGEADQPHQCRERASTLRTAPPHPPRRPLDNPKTPRQQRPTGRNDHLDHPHRPRTPPTTGDLPRRHDEDPQTGRRRRGRRSPAVLDVRSDQPAEIERCAQPEYGTASVS